MRNDNRQPHGPASLPRSTELKTQHNGRNDRGCSDVSVDGSSNLACYEWSSTESHHLVNYYTSIQQA